MSKKKILIIALVVLLGGGYVAKGMLMPAKKTKEKVSGTIYQLPKDFTVNLADGHYGKLTIALLLSPGQSDGSSAGGEGGSSSSSETGLGTLPEEALVRDIITNVLTNQTGSTLIDASGRARVKKKIVQAIRVQTDVKVSDVLFTDVAVQ